MIAKKKAATRGRSPPRASAKESTEALVSRALRKKLDQHLAGDPTAARDALAICARFRVVMPRWLGDIVGTAVANTRKGLADEVLGLGSVSTLRRWKKVSLALRNAGIRNDFIFLSELAGQRGGVDQALDILAETHRRSRKNIEKIVYPSDSPTQRTKK